jgi:hypothetical protein
MSVLTANKPCPSHSLYDLFADKPCPSHSLYDLFADKPCPSHDLSVSGRYILHIRTRMSVCCPDQERIPEPRLILSLSLSPSLSLSKSDNFDTIYDFGHSQCCNFSSNFGRRVWGGKVLDFFLKNFQIWMGEDFPFSST